MRPRAMLLIFLVGISYSSLFSDLAEAAQMCGLETAKGTPESNEKRFVILSGYEGRAFIDMRSCLVWDLHPSGRATSTLAEAASFCMHKFQGGPEGEMGWKLPTVDELTSLDSESWRTQREEFTEYKLPTIDREEHEFWTSSPNIGQQNTYTAVTFGGRTVYFTALMPEKKAGVWCVRGYRATGLK